MRDKELRLQEKIQELSREHKLVKQLNNQLANMVSHSSIVVTTSCIVLATLAVFRNACTLEHFQPLQSAHLKSETARASYLSLHGDPTLAGSALAAEVDKLVQSGIKGPPDFWERLMSQRSQVIIAANNKHMREKAALEQRQQELQVGPGGGK